MRNDTDRVVAVTVLALALSACATSTDVAKINANKRDHLVSEFTPETLGSGIVAQIKKEDATSNDFREINVQLLAAYDEDSKIRYPVVSSTYINVGNGMMQQLSEYSNNGIPFRLRYSLTYRGILPLKAQDVRLDKERALHPAVTKRIGKLPIELLTARENGELKFEFSAGYETQLADLWKFGATCHSARRYAANSLHRALTGDALDLMCEYSRDGTLAWTARYVFLQRYGIALLLEQTGAFSRLSSTIIDVKIR